MTMYLPMTVRFTREFLVGADLKSTRHLQIPASAVCAQKTKYYLKGAADMVVELKVHYSREKFQCEIFKKSVKSFGIFQQWLTSAEEPFYNS